MAPGGRAAGGGFSSRTTTFVWVGLGREVLDRTHGNYWDLRAFIAVNVLFSNTDSVSPVLKGGKVCIKSAFLT